jgi:hypothetical protein
VSPTTTDPAPLLEDELPVAAADDELPVAAADEPELCAAPPPVAVPDVCVVVLDT